MKNARNDGRDFEKSIEQCCRIYREKGIARIEKVEPPVRVLGYGPSRKVIFLQSPYLDFTGTWTAAAGRSIHFEAKSTLEPTLQCGKKTKFHQGQRDALRDWHQAGAMAFLLWEMRGECRLFFHSMIEAGLEQRKSLVFSDGLKVPAGKGFMFYDFLSVVSIYPEQ